MDPKIFNSYLADLPSPARRRGDGGEGLARGRPGATTLRLDTLPYRQLPQPIYPLSLK
jgi:hypothetical protein